METASLLAFIAPVVGPSMAMSDSTALKERAGPEKVREWGQQRSARQPSHQGVSNHLPASPLFFFFREQNKELCLLPLDCNDETRGFW